MSWAILIRSSQESDRSLSFRTSWRVPPLMNYRYGKSRTSYHSQLHIEIPTIVQVRDKNHYRKCTKRIAKPQMVCIQYIRTSVSACSCPSWTQQPLYLWSGRNADCSAFYYMYVIELDANTAEHGLHTAGHHMKSFVWGNMIHSSVKECCTIYFPYGNYCTHVSLNCLRMVITRLWCFWFIATAERQSDYLAGATAAADAEDFTTGAEKQ